MGLMEREKERGKKGRRKKDFLLHCEAVYADLHFCSLPHLWVLAVFHILNFLSLPFEGSCWLIASEILLLIVICFNAVAEIKLTGTPALFLRLFAKPLLFRTFEKREIIFS